MLKRILGSTNTANNQGTFSLETRDPWQDSSYPRFSATPSIRPPIAEEHPTPPTDLGAKLASIYQLSRGFDHALATSDLEKTIQKTEELVTSYQPEMGHRRYSRKQTNLPWNISIFDKDQVYLSPGHLGSSIGRGSYKQGWKAIDYVNENVVANLKIKPRSGLKYFSQREWNMIMSEFHFGSLMNPNRIQAAVYVGSRDRQPTSSVEIFMDKADGTLTKFKPKNSAEILHMFSNMLSEVISLHRFAVHRDIKLENFLFFNENPSNPTCKLTDFGFCSNDDRQIRSINVGTVDFLPPLMVVRKKLRKVMCKNRAEAVEGDKYALGLCLYQLLVGNPNLLQHPLAQLSRKINERNIDTDTSLEKATQGYKMVIEKFYRQQESAMQQMNPGLQKDLFKIAHKLVTSCYHESLSLEEIKEQLDRLIQHSKAQSNEQT